MKTVLPKFVYTTQASQRLIVPGNLPFAVHNECIASDGSINCWCTHTIGMELVVYVSGSGILRTPNVVNHMHRGSVCLIPPDVHTLHVPDQGSQINYWNFLFLEDKLTVGNVNLSESPRYARLKNFQSTGVNRISPVVCLDSALVNEIDVMAQEIAALQIFHPENYQIYCASAFIYLVGRIFSEYHKNHSEFSSLDNKIEKISNYIERNCMQQFTLDMLAQKFGMSPSSLSHLFKKAKNISVIEYAIRCRLQKAISMFEHCNDINKIALECGFIDLPYFSRTFRSRLGITPSRFKQLSREEHQQYCSKLQLK